MCPQFAGNIFFVKKLDHKPRHFGDQYNCSRVLCSDRRFSFACESYLAKLIQLYTQQATVQVYLNNTMFHAENFNLTASNTTTVTCICNSTTFLEGNYNLTVKTFATDNEKTSFASTLTGNDLLVTYAADLTGNFDVDYQDVTAITNAYVDYTPHSIYLQEQTLTTTPMSTTPT